MCVDYASGSLSNEEAGISLDHECEKSSRSDRSAAGKIREQVDDALAACDAISFKRAFRAARFSRCANERSEFHEGLVELGIRRRTSSNSRWGERPREPGIS